MHEQVKVQCLLAFSIDLLQLVLASLVLVLLLRIYLNVSVVLRY